MRRTKLLLIGMLFAVQSTAAYSDDYKEAIDAAYCFGVDQSDIEHSLRLTKTADVSRPTEKNYNRSALIDRVLKSGRIDIATVRRMKVSGYAEASSCFDKSEECKSAYAKSSKQQRDQCEIATQSLCDKIDVCDDEEDKRRMDELMRND
jgi:hypothetical protein